MARVYDNGAYRDPNPTEAEEAKKALEEWKREQFMNPPKPTIEEQIAELREENRILNERAAALERAALNGGVNHV